MGGALLYIMCFFIRYPLGPTILVFVQSKLYTRMSCTRTFSLLNWAQKNFCLFLVFSLYTFLQSFPLLLINTTTKDSHTSLLPEFSCIGYKWSQWEDSSQDFLSSPNSIFKKTKRKGNWGNIQDSFAII